MVKNEIVLHDPYSNAMCHPPNTGRFLTWSSVQLFMRCLFQGLLWEPVVLRPHWRSILGGEGGETILNRTCHLQICQTKILFWHIERINDQWNTFFVLFYLKSKFLVLAMFLQPVTETFLIILSKIWDFFNFINIFWQTSTESETFLISLSKTYFFCNQYFFTACRWDFFESIFQRLSRQSAVGKINLSFIVAQNFFFNHILLCDSIII